MSIVSQFCRPLAAVAVVLAGPAFAWAGMPRVTTVLNEVAAQRVEVISFFLVVLLLAAAGVRWLWNGLTADFPRLPRLGYGRALGVVVVWGAAFVLVLAMISGARELMTPGAWKPDGVTYKLADGTMSTAPEPPPAGPSEDQRRRKLDDLRVVLWTHAAAHEGSFPADMMVPTIPESLWQTPHPSGMRYLYVPGGTTDPTGPRRVVAYEPELFGEFRFALFADGEVRRLTTPELRAALER